MTGSDISAARHPSGAGTGPTDSSDRAITTSEASDLDTAGRDAADLDLVLGPATRLLWRSEDEVHLELGARAVVVEGLPAAVIGRLARPTPRSDPRGSASTTDAPAGRSPAPMPDALRAVLAGLRTAGYLWPRRPPGEDRVDPDADLRRPPEPRLAGDLASLAADHGVEAAAVLEARRYCSVEVHGTNRAAVHLAAVLAAAGVGRVRCPGDSPVRLAQAVPGGFGPGDEGRPRAATVQAALQRVAPSVDTTPLPTGERADLTIIAADAPVSPERRDALHAAGAPHLVVTLGAGRGVIGPLVVPGLTSCLRCADLHRRDRDPAWSSLAAQLAVPGRYAAPSDVAVSTVVAGVAALQALAFLDGGDPETLDGTIEVHQSDWRLRRRSWLRHPDCDCG